MYIIQHGYTTDPLNCKMLQAVTQPATGRADDCLRLCSSGVFATTINQF